jgi:hypothetical protein
MAEFFEVPIRREDGSEGLLYVNIEAVAYADCEGKADKGLIDGMKIYLNNGYWFTLSGTKAEGVLNLIKNRACFRLDQGTGDN